MHKSDFGYHDSSQPFHPVQNGSQSTPGPAARKRFVAMLDSGAYSVWNRGINIDLNTYAEFALSNQSLFRGGIFNLDVIGSAPSSYENWLELRRMGLLTIPVHHVDDDPIYLKKYLDQCDYVGIGAISHASSKMRVHGLDAVWNDYLLTDGGKSRCKVHGMGLTATAVMVRYPWHSVDSTKAIQQAGFGNLLFPRFKGFSYDDLSNLVVSDQAIFSPSSSMCFYSFSEGIKKSITNFLSSLGFEINQTLDGRVLKERIRSRKTKRAVWDNGLDLSDDEVNGIFNHSSSSNNVSTSWPARYKFNLLSFDRFAKYWHQYGKIIRIYTVLSPGQCDIYTDLTDSHPVNRLLVSFADFKRARKSIGVSEKKAYRRQKYAARWHHIEWDLTFDEWLRIWQDSGHLHERGNGTGLYCMARNGGEGPYSPDNVSIVTDIPYFEKVRMMIDGSRTETVVGSTQVGIASNDAERVIRTVGQDSVCQGERGGVQRRRSNTSPPAWRP